MRPYVRASRCGCCYFRHAFADTPCRKRAVPQLVTTICRVVSSENSPRNQAARLPEFPPFRPGKGKRRSLICQSLIRHQETVIGQGVSFFTGHWRSPNECRLWASCHGASVWRKTARFQNNCEPDSALRRCLGRRYSFGMLHERTQANRRLRIEDLVSCWARTRGRGMVRRCGKRGLNHLK